MIDDGTGSAQQYTCTEVIHVVQVYVYGTCSSRVPGYSINVCMCAPVHLYKYRGTHDEGSEQGARESTYRVLQVRAEFTCRIIDLKNR